MDVGLTQINCVPNECVKSPQVVCSEVWNVVNDPKTLGFVNESEIKASETEWVKVQLFI